MKRPPAQPGVEMREAETLHVGGCQNYGPVLGTLIIRCRIINGIKKGP